MTNEYCTVRPIIRKKINGENVYCSYANLPAMFPESKNQCIGVLHVPKRESTTSQYGFQDFLDHVEPLKKEFIESNLEENEIQILEDYRK